MKRILVIASALACAVLVNAQVLSFKHDGKVIKNGGEICVSTYDVDMLEVGILQFTPHIKLNGTEEASKSNPVTVQVEHLDGETLELCAFGACMPYQSVVSATATNSDVNNGLPANTDVDIQLHSSWIMDKSVASSKCKISAWYGDDESKAVSFTLYMSNDSSIIASIDNYKAFDSIEDTYNEALAKIQAVLASLSDYPAIQAQWLNMLNAVLVGENATGEEYDYAMGVFQQIEVYVQIFLEQNESFTEILSQVENILTNISEEDLAVAFEVAKGIDWSITTYEDFLEVYNKLRKELAIYTASQISRDDWAFNTWNQVAVDDLLYYIDETNHLAEFVGLSNNTSLTELNIPEVIKYNGADYAVVSVINEHRYTQNTIQKVTLPKTLQYIGRFALAYYKALTSIDIPVSVSYIDYDAFVDCTALTDIYLHSSTPIACDENISDASVNRLRIHVPDGAFHDYRISSPWGNYVIIPETPVVVNINVVDEGDLGNQALDQAGYLQEINKLIVTGALNNEDWAYIKSMKNLIEIDMSGVVNKTIPAALFYNRAIKQVVLPSNVESINSQAFEGSCISSVDFPKTLKTIENNAFNGCIDLQSVEFPGSLQSLGDYAFANCSNLKTVHFNDGLTTIPNSCFSSCGISELTLPSTLLTIGRYAFAHNHYLEVLNCPEALRNIEYRAFYSCYLKQLNLNEGLQRIDNWAFAENDLKMVTLPSSLLSCVGSPFANCSFLQTFVCNAVVPPATDNSSPVSNQYIKQVKLIVPSWSLTEYQLAEGWNQFTNVEVSDYMPQNIVINKDFVFALRDTLDADYRPNIDLLWTDRSYTDGFGYSNYEHGNLTINSRSKLPVNNFSMYMSPFAKYYLDYNQYYRIVNGSDYYENTKYNPTCLKVNGEMRAENVTIRLMNQNSRWQFVSFPFDVRMSDIVPEDSLTQWVVREYSGENRANNMLDSTWVDLKKDDVLKAGKGYIMHCYNSNANSGWNATPVIFSVTPVKESVNRQALFIADDRSVALEEHLAEFDHNRSWNLVGNPYPTFYDSRFLDFTAPITIWNSRDNNYMAVSPVDDDFILSPGEAFFVQRPVEQESITFVKEGRQTYNHVRLLQREEMPRFKASVADNRQLINLVLSDGEHSDRTRVVINENATMGYDLNVDASKFDAVDASVPQLFTVAGNVRYAINERPLGDAVVELGLHVGAEGMFTLTLKDNVEGSIVIEDRLTGLMTEITAEKGYTFSADKAGDIMGRFFLHLNMQQGGATGIEGVEALDGEDNAPAYNLNGQRVNANTYKGVVVKKGSKRVK